IASRPSVERDGGGYRSDLGATGTRIFLQPGLDRQITDLPVGHQLRLVQAQFRVVPANAGTHNRRRLLEQGPLAAVRKPRVRGVWVPAFAGTTVAGVFALSELL